jgi:hypothetical protein
MTRVKFFRKEDRTCEPGLNQGQLFDMRDRMMRGEQDDDIQILSSSIGKRKHKQALEQEKMLKKQLNMMKPTVKWRIPKSTIVSFFFAVDGANLVGLWLIF